MPRWEPPTECGGKSLWPEEPVSELALYLHTIWGDPRLWLPSSGGPILLSCKSGLASSWDLSNSKMFTPLPTPFLRIHSQRDSHLGAGDHRCWVRAAPWFVEDRLGYILKGHEIKDGTFMLWGADPGL